MRFFNAGQIELILDYSNLIQELRAGFRGDYEVPERHHHNYPNPSGEKESTLLLMPAWEKGKNLGVKVVTISPENGKIDLPSIHGLYLYFDAQNGEPLAVMDAKALTKLRTAATSALASSYLSKKSISSMAMIGTGALAPELIKAHCSVRDIDRVVIWGRDPNKARQIAKNIKIEGVKISQSEDLEYTIKESELISTATLSKDPLVLGKWLSEGQHLDLVGSYKPDMRESDDEAIQRSSIFVDFHGGAPRESGDLSIPLKTGILKMEDIKGDLFGLCKDEVGGRQRDSEITWFKSVGHALEDLVAAKLVYNNSLENE